MGQIKVGIKYIWGGVECLAIILSDQLAILNIELIFLKNPGKTPIIQVRQRPIYISLIYYKLSNMFKAFTSIKIYVNSDAMYLLVIYQISVLCLSVPSFLKYKYLCYHKIWNPLLKTGLKSTQFLRFLLIFQEKWWFIGKHFLASEE